MPTHSQEESQFLLSTQVLCWAHQVAPPWPDGQSTKWDLCLKKVQKAGSGVGSSLDFEHQYVCELTPAVSIPLL